MLPLSRDDLFTLERYSEVRPEFRSRVLAHKRNRQVRIGEHTTLYFEDRLTIQYQVQEMLRVERIFESTGIEEELESYNPLIPDGSNLKATFMIEYEDPKERAGALERLKGIEDRVWVRAGESERVFAIADEDLERANDTKTSAVHFLRFQLSDTQREAAKAGQSLHFGIDHPAYAEEVEAAPEVVGSLVVDLD